MDVVGPILDIFTRLWDCIAKIVRTVKDLRTNQKALQNALEQLKDVSEDVKRRVELQEQRHMVRTKQVDGWLHRVEDIDKAVEDVLMKASQMPHRSCCVGCPNECWSSYKIGEELKEKLKDVDELKNEGKFDSVAEALPHGIADERPLVDTVGLNLVFEKVQRWIKDSTVKVIGIHGMGGVGKTTLLKKINNSFVGTNCGFNQVIWVVISKPSSIEKVQNTICEQLNLPVDAWENKSEDDKAVQIFNILCKKKFVLLLDDMWERLDLVRVGVPTSDDPRMPKVVFTTRFEHVCDSMRSDQKIKLECLAREEALALFKKSVGTNTLNAHSSIQKHAEILADECKGLPLALITVGRAMAGKKNPSDWDRAVKKLQKDPSTIMGMEDDVFRILRFSYDSLPNDTIRSCFVYCCIYPEDYEISTADLVQLWIGEGFLDKFDDVHEARDQGQEIIDSLIATSLLESAKSKNKVKMHDVIRDMALWISGGSKGKTNRYLVIDNVGLRESQLGNRIMETERVSLWSRAVEITAEFQHSWPNTITFLARPRSDRLRKMLHSEFLLSMPHLKVLDLFYNGSLIELPPGISKLVELQFLNLSHTRIRELPAELKNLTKLKYLLLEWTSCIVIPRQVISSFSLLRVFRLFGILYGAGLDNKEGHNIKLSGSGLLEELECLPHINDVSITLFDATSIEKLMNSQKLLYCLSSLEIKNIEGLTLLKIFASSMERMRRLQRLDIRSCKFQQLIISRTSGFMAHGCFNKLRDVGITLCNSLLDLTWLIYAPMLESLYVARCSSMVKIVGDDTSDITGVEAANSDMFSQLKSIRLVNLPCLQSVCPRALPFPSLVEIKVYSCPNVRRLPLDSTSAQGSLKEIRGAQGWWNALEWEDEKLEPLFRPYFIPRAD